VWRAASALATGPTTLPPWAAISKGDILGNRTFVLDDQYALTGERASRALLLEPLRQFLVGSSDFAHLLPGVRVMECLGLDQ
jgi:hypothetical protein